jgi:hypothetical protein
VYPGVIGNNFGFRVENWDAETTVFDLVFYKFVGNRWTQLERIAVSRNRVRDGMGYPLFIEDRVGRFGLPFRVVNNPAISGDIAPGMSPEVTEIGMTVWRLENGTDGMGGVSTGDIVQAWNEAQFEAPEPIRVALTFGEGDPSVGGAVSAFADSQERCISIVDAPFGDYDTIHGTGDGDGWADKIGLSDRRVMKVHTWHQQLDSFNDTNIYLPPSVIVSILLSNNRTTAPYRSFAGTRRGSFSCLKLNLKLSDRQRDNLLKKRVNGLARIGIQYLLEDIMTGQMVNSAFSNMNNVILADDMISNCVTFLQGFVHEYNDEPTRGVVEGGTQSILDVFIGRGDVIDALAICNDNNNTEIIIESERMIVDVFVQFKRIAKQIHITLTAVRGQSGIDVSMV